MALIGNVKYLQSAFGATGDVTGARTVTGGAINSLGKYKVHMFKASGNFIVSGGNITADIMMVGGGGGGGSRHSGGGVGFRGANKMDLVDIQQFTMHDGVNRGEEGRVHLAFEQHRQDVGVVIQIAIVEGQPDGVVRQVRLALASANHIMGIDDFIVASKIVDLLPEFREIPAPYGWIAAVPQIADEMISHDGKRH